MQPKKIKASFAVIKKFKYTYLSDSDRKELREAKDSIQKAAKPEHIPSVSGEFMTDWIDCSCGWQSHHYWDGVEWALDGWYDHVRMEVDKSTADSLYA